MEKGNAPFIHEMDGASYSGHLVPFSYQHHAEQSALTSICRKSRARDFAPLYDARLQQFADRHYNLGQSDSVIRDTSASIV